MDDIYEPLERFRDELRDKHAENAAALFDKLVERSGIDLPANRRTVEDIRGLEKELREQRSRRQAWSTLNVFSIVAAVAAAVTLLWGFFGADEPLPPVANLVSAGVALVGILIAACLCRPRLRELKESIENLDARRAAAEQEAWQQMAPLNRLFDWGQPAALIHQTAPRIEFDPYFSEGRLRDLRRVFGWDGTFNQSRSVLFSHSGEINGNPFVLAETLSCQMVPKTYTGTLEISWTETYRDSDGKLQTRTRYQTLRASVTKPFPEYSAEKTVIYGCGAAPDLTFSRDPSPLSSVQDGAIGRWRKRAEIRRLEKFSRNLDDDSNYTIMSNREFEALFHATDRSDEIQFRLLFTPLAQTQMLRLLQDHEVGYGDDFRFVKSRRVNYIRPEHLQNLRVDTDPAQFRSYDCDGARQAFLAFNAEFFRGLYFALAPLLSIPLYQQHRSHESIYGTRDDRCSSFWEHEALANYYGDARFRHPDCVTRCLLKTAPVQTGPDGARRVAVTAHGYRGVPRVDYVAVWGGDGRMHDVPVHWTEYLPVQRTSPIDLAETDNLTLQDYQDRLAAPTGRPDLPCPWDPRTIASVFRRSIVARTPDP